MPHSDSLLIRRALAGNQKTFQALYEAHRRKITGVLAPAPRGMADRDTVEDLVQATFIRPFGALHTFQGRAAISNLADPDRPERLQVPLDGVEDLAELDSGNRRP